MGDREVGAGRVSGGAGASNEAGDLMAPEDEWPGGRPNAARQPEDPSSTHDEGDLHDLRPKGAIMVTAITAVTILVMFFGVLGILMARG